MPPRLSLCMIVRDNESIIGDCLASIRPWVDEMIVVDTGSIDGTPDVAQSMGARVFFFPWCDSFAAARNESLRHATGDWLFWMDSDDVMPAQNGQGLRLLADGGHPPDRLGYVMQVHCLGPDGEVSTVVDHVKLVAAREPDDAATQHNLGIALMHCDRLAAAVLAFERSLALRPDDADTRRDLARARERLRPATSAVTSAT